MTPIKAAIACSLLAAVACGKRATEPTTARPAAPVVTAVNDAAPAAAAATAPIWELVTGPLALDCGLPSIEDTSYKSALGEGRAAARKKQWGLAMKGFEVALVAKQGDATALSELSWATLQAGDAGAALDLGEQAVSAATEPKLQAAAHYNAGRAAEALGDLPRARTHYEQSIALRASPAVSDRLARLAAPEPRRLGAARAMTVCQQLPSVEAVCECLAKSLDRWTSIVGGAGACEPAEQEGSRAQLVIVHDGSFDADDSSVGAVIVLVARHGAGWSALRVVDGAPPVDPEQTLPMERAVVLGYQERALGGATLVWVHTYRQSWQNIMGDEDVRGAAALTLCTIPEGKAAPSCRQPLSLGAWDYSHSTRSDDVDDGCAVVGVTTYRARLDSLGRLFLALTAGLDDGRSGRYQL